MLARRQEEAITSDGHRERRGGRDGRAFRSGAGGQRAIGGHSTSSQLFSSPVLPPVKRVVFAGGGTEIDLLHHEVHATRRWELLA